MPIINHFDFVAPWYDRVAHTDDPEPYRSLLAVSGGTLLDAGGGTGRVGALLAKWADQVVVVDVSMGMLRQAGTKDALRLTRAEVESLPLANESIDRIVMADAFHHVRDQAGVIQEMWRVLRPGGRIVIEEPNIHTFPVKIIAVVEKLLLMRSHIRTPEAIAAYFKSFPHCQVSITYRGYVVFVQIVKNEVGTA
ncbi:MAG TPA: class I SAM-dependent methyltransferase [Anaerolineaceae bacterium]|nr:class I SAM-dependent methyltransferase [Anaerolineaceae bacterium]